MLFGDYDAVKINQPAYILYEEAVATATIGYLSTIIYRLYNTIKSFIILSIAQYFKALVLSAICIITQRKSPADKKTFPEWARFIVVDNSQVFTGHATQQKLPIQ